LTQPLLNGQCQTANCAHYAPSKVKHFSENDQTKSLVISKKKKLCLEKEW
jgi:hypothetical protein